MPARPVMFEPKLDACLRHVAVLFVHADDGRSGFRLTQLGDHRCEPRAGVGYFYNPEGRGFAAGVERDALGEAVLCGDLNDQVWQGSILRMSGNLSVLEISTIITRKINSVNIISDTFGRLSI